MLMLPGWDLSASFQWKAIAGALAIAVTMERKLPL